MQVNLLILCVQAKTADAVTADYSQESTNWGDNDTSVFEMKIVKQLRGEFQLTNGYGSNATSVLRLCILCGSRRS